MLPQTVRLNNGIDIPSIGFGTWQVPAREAKQAVLAALAAGYRLIDTSLAYWNEAEVGEAIRESGIDRDQIFVTTKLEGEDHGSTRTIRGFRRSLANLDIGYIDLFLIHWPGDGARIETWKAMEELAANEACRSIGVSNYTIHHLHEILEYGEVVPVVDQVEIHPLLFPQELIDFCTKNYIQVESYSPLMKAQELYNPAITAVAAKHGRTPAQVVLRWHLQHDLIPLPRSVNPDHIKENIAVFDFSLDHEDMAAIDALDRDLHLDWDPTNVR